MNDYFQNGVDAALDAYGVKAASTRMMREYLKSPKGSDRQKEIGKEMLGTRKYISPDKVRPIVKKDDGSVERIGLVPDFEAALRRTRNNPEKRTLYNKPAVELTKDDPRWLLKPDWRLHPSDPLRYRGNPVRENRMNTPSAREYSERTLRQNLSPDTFRPLQTLEQRQKALMKIKSPNPKQTHEMVLIDAALERGRPDLSRSMLTEMLLPPRKG